MLAEIATTRTHSQGYRRRWYQSDTMDLYTWQTDLGRFVGFQLAYDRGAEQRAITWLRGRGYFHARIDEDSRGLVATTPFLVPIDGFDVSRVHSEFRQSASELDRDVVLLVSRRLEAYRLARGSWFGGAWRDLAVAALVGAVLGTMLRRR